MGLNNPNLSKNLSKHFQLLEIDWLSFGNDKLKLQAQIILDVEYFKPNLCFIHIQNDGVLDQQIFKWLSSKCFTINWTGDIRFPIPDFYVKNGNNVNITCFSNETDVKQFRELGFNTEYLQVGYDSEQFKPNFDLEEKDYENDIVFLGSNYDNFFPLSNFRKQIVQELKKEYKERFKVFGAGWNGLESGIINNYKEECYLYQKSKIALNISHFNYERYSSDRLFRIMGSGCFCISHNYLGLDKDFVEYKHLVTFEKIEDLKEQIERYLNNHTARYVIRNQGYEKGFNNFSWNNFAINIQKIYDKYKMQTETEKSDWVELIPNITLEKKYCQFKEENIYDFIFKNIGTTNKYLVDFGASSLGYGFSNSRYLLECGWNGLKMDGNPSEDEIDIKKEIITTENIVSLFEKYNVPKEFDFLSIDIDGNDYWVLRAILLAGYKPRVIENEFNGCIENDKCIAIENNPSHIWNNNDYYGASFLAFKKIMEHFGYVLIHQIATTNQIFVLGDLVDKKEYNITYTPQQYHAKYFGGNWVNV